MRGNETNTFFIIVCGLLSNYKVLYLFWMIVSMSFDGKSFELGKCYLSKALQAYSSRRL